VGQGHSNQRTTTCNVPVLDIEIETGKRKRGKKGKRTKMKEKEKHPGATRRKYQHPTGLAVFPLGPRAPMP